MSTRRQLPLFKARIRRGRRVLENPPAPPRCKRPVRAFVHFRSSGDELLAFAISASWQAIDKLRFSAAHANVVEHWVDDRLDPRARLVVLPSQVAAGEAIETLAA